MYRVVTTHRGYRRVYAEDQLHVGSSAPLHFVPVVAGGGGGKALGIGLLVAGALLLTAGIAAPLIGVSTTSAFPPARSAWSARRWRSWDAALAHDLPEHSADSVVQ